MGWIEDIGGAEGSMDGVYFLYLQIENVVCFYYW